MSQINIAAPTPATSISYVSLFSNAGPCSIGMKNANRADFLACAIASKSNGMGRSKLWSLLGKHEGIAKTKVLS